MTLFAWIFVLFIASVVAATIPVRRLAIASLWVLLSANCALVAWLSIPALARGANQTLAELMLPVIGSFSFTLTPLSALFLLITAIVFTLTLPFALHDSTAYSRTRRWAFVTLIIMTFAAMVALFTAASVVAFIFSWEMAALSIWALVTFETRHTRPVAAGFLTISMSEAGSLAGLAGLLILASAAGTAQLEGIAAAASSLPRPLVVVTCILTFFGFGMKAGIIPLNQWLPAAYSNAPRSISPILAGATTNLGLYAILRIDAPLAQTDPALGLMILATGAVTALIGIMYALSQRDIKLLLAESSIENIGIATAGFGAGFAFSALGHPVLGGLALIAGLYHTINHSTYKTLMFLGAGGLEAATGTRNLDHMGGLLRRLPVLGTLFIIGGFSIAALPPSNGFVSEWMLLQSLLRVVEISSIPVRIVFALSGAALALTAGLAVTCFIMVVASSLLGIPRSRAAATARHAPRTVWIPMAVLAVICFGLGVLATAVIPVLGRIAAPITGTDPTDALVPAFFGHVQILAQSLVQGLGELGAELGRGVIPLRGLIVLNTGGASTNVTYAMSTAVTFVILVFLLLVVWLCVHSLQRRRRVTRQTLWDAGLVHLRPEMTYTATTFAAPVRVLFHSVFSPVTIQGEKRQGAFLIKSRRRELARNPMDRFFILPITATSRGIAHALARIHNGSVNTYASYVLITLLVVLLLARGLMIS